MDLLSILTNKPVLIGLHLGFAILGIDAFLWVLGEVIANVKSQFRIKLASVIGVAAFVVSWVIGGHYYLTVYGSQVKPIIKGGLAPWAHLVFMETKEHIFLFIIPLTITIFFLTFFSNDDLKKNNLRFPTLILVGLIVFIGLAVGAMGFIISAAARWG